MSTHRVYRFRLIAFIAISYGGAALYGQLPLRLPTTSTETEKVEADSNDTDVMSKEDRASIRQRMAQVRLTAEKQPEGVLRTYLVRELETLKWLDSVFSSCESTLARYNELLVESEQIQGGLQSTGLDVANMSFIELDELRDEILNEERRVQSIQLEIATTRATLQVARDSKQAVDARRRLTREASEAESDPQKRLHLRRECEIDEIVSRAYALSVEQIRLELKVSDLELQNSKARYEFLQQQVATVMDKVRFSKEDLEAKFEQIGLLDTGLRQLDADLQRRLREAEQQWTIAKQNRTATAEVDLALDEQLAAWQQARELRQERLTFLKQVLAYVGHSRNVWRLRYQLANRLGTPADFKSWRDDVLVWREELARLQQLIGIRVDEHLGDAASIKKRLISFRKEQPEVLPWIQHQEREIDAVLGHYASLAVVTKAFDRMLNRFEQDLTAVVKPTSVRQTLEYAMNLSRASWDYEITVVDDQPVTVGKVTFGIVLWAVGFVISRTLSRLFGHRILPRLGLNSGASQAFQSIAFYLMLTIFGCVALEMINVPLTVFAFFGGTAAIGIGFGSQNILNNFISGLIVLAERPIRVGDLVEIGGLTGTIERIGARSTRVKTGSNLEIIVPNSTFLENNVTNWTLSDTRIRTMISVGVAYGSPTTEVNNLLHQAIVDHPKVLTSPDPIILFKEFGDNSLVFEMHFWLHLKTMMDAERVSSDIRHRIDAILADANIVIAYPQRDVHLDAIAPIEVNVRQIPDLSELPVRRASA